MRQGAAGRLVSGTSAAVVLLVSLAGCADPGYAPYSGKVTNGDVIGNWSSNCGASLDIDPKGVVSATAFPNLTDVSGKPTKTFNGRGEWSLYDAPPGGGDSGLFVNVGNVLYTLDYASVSGKLGFAFDVMVNDPDDEELCIFSRA